MRTYAAWPDGDDEDPLSVETIRAYMAAEKDRGLLPNSLIARYSSFLAFFKWAIKNEHHDGPSPMDKIGRPPKPKSAARRAKRADVLEVINSIPFANWWLDQRDRTIIQILLCCGLRIGELCALTVDDIDTVGWSLSVPPIKQSKRRSIPLGADDMEASNTIRYDIDNWLRVRPTNHPTDALFLGYSGPYTARGPLRTDGARNAIKQRCEHAGVKYFNPHSIRHCFATNAINSGVRAEILQVLMGHASIVVTLEIYAEVLNDRIIEEARGVLAHANSQ